MMPSFWANSRTVFRREMAAYFNQAIAYIFIIVFVLVNGGLYMTQFFLIGRADMRSFFGLLPFILIIFLSAVTMRLWAEERKGNTLELLLTFPMRPEELVLGKFFASLVFYLAALAGTLPIPVMLKVLGNPDLGAIAAAYLGAVLLGAFFLAVGIFISGLCRDQIVAFILSLMASFSLYLAGTELIAASIDGWIPGFGSFLNHCLGTARHFEAFPRGVVDNRDVLYFGIGTVLFLVLNGFWLEGRMRPKARTVFSSAAVICAGIFLTANWFLSDIPLGRFDFTQGGIYTIAPATRNILRALKAPVMIKFYVSPADKMPTGMKTLEQDVTGKLDELRIASQGNLQYKIFHMEAANAVEEKPEGQAESFEEQISRKGIEPFQVQSIETDEVGVRLVYAALSIAYKEKPEEIIGRLMPESLDELEYAVMSKIYRMTLAQEPKLAMVAPYEDKTLDPQLLAVFAQMGMKLPQTAREDNYSLVLQALQYEGYSVERIKLNRDEPVPAGTRTLILLEPAELNERQLYEINRFLVEGGSLFLAVQNYEFHYRPAGPRLGITGVDKKPGINPLLAAWGLGVDEHVLADAQHESISLSGAARMGPFPVSVPVKLPVHVIVTPDEMNAHLSITSRLATLFYLWGSPLDLDLEKIRAQDLKQETLFHSSRNSWTVPFSDWDVTPDSFDPSRSVRQGPFPLAVWVEGQFRNAFEGKPVPAWPEEETAESTPEAAKKSADEKNPAEQVPALTPHPGKLILTGASMMFQKQLAPAGGHLNFLMNSVDILTLGDELVTIRSKQPADRSLGRVPAAAKMGWRFFVTLLVPILIALLGTLRMMLRRRAKQNYLKTLAQPAS